MKSIEPEIFQSSSKQKNPVEQGSVHSDKNCQDTKSRHLCVVKPAMKTNYMWFMQRQAMPQFNYKKRNR